MSNLKGMKLDIDGYTHTEMKTIDKEFEYRYTYLKGCLVETSPWTNLKPHEFIAQTKRVGLLKTVRREKHEI